MEYSEIPKIEELSEMLEVQVEEVENISNVQCECYYAAERPIYYQTCQYGSSTYMLFELYADSDSNFEDNIILNNCQIHKVLNTKSTVCFQEFKGLFSHYDGTDYHYYAAFSMLPKQLIASDVKKLPYPIQMRYLEEIIDIIGYLVDLGISHRCINTQSFYIKDGHILLANFYFAKFFHEELQPFHLETPIYEEELKKLAMQPKYQDFANAFLDIFSVVNGLGTMFVQLSKGSGKRVLDMSDVEKIKKRYRDHEARKTLNPKHVLLEIQECIYKRAECGIFYPITSSDFIEQEVILDSDGSSLLKFNKTSNVFKILMNQISNMFSVKSPIKISEKPGEGYDLYYMNYKFLRDKFEAKLMSMNGDKPMHWNITYPDKYSANDCALLDVFLNRRDSKPYNKEDSRISVIPVIHGTNFKAARCISKNGFRALQKLDNGFFGKGCYFTNVLGYSKYYASQSSEGASTTCRHANPTIIVSLVNIGNMMFVNEKVFHDMGFVMGMGAAGKSVELPKDIDTTYTIVEYLGKNTGIRQNITDVILNNYRTNFHSWVYADELCVADGANILPLFILTEENI